MPHAQETKKIWINMYTAKQNLNNYNAFQIKFYVGIGLKHQRKKWNRTRNTIHSKIV